MTGKTGLKSSIRAYKEPVYKPVEEKLEPLRFLFLPVQVGFFPWQVDRQGYFWRKKWTNCQTGKSPVDRFSDGTGCWAKTYFFWSITLFFSVRQPMTAADLQDATELKAKIEEYRASKKK